MWRYMKWVLSFSLLLLAGCLGAQEVAPVITPNMTVEEALKLTGTCYNENGEFVAFNQGKLAVGANNTSLLIYEGELFFIRGDERCEWYRVNISKNFTAQLQLTMLMKAPINQLMENPQCTSEIEKEWFEVTGEVCEWEG